MLGVDPASSLAGFAVADAEDLVALSHWKPVGKGSKNDHLLDFFTVCGSMMDAFKPDIVGYEQVQSSRNMNTVRVLARWESAVIIQARARRIVVQPVRVKQAREVVFSDGAIEKEEVLRRLRVRYPDLGWLKSNSGGLDQADAGVVALAAPELLERR